MFRLIICDGLTDRKKHSKPDRDFGVPETSHDPINSPLSFAVCGAACVIRFWFLLWSRIRTMHAVLCEVLLNYYYHVWPKTDNDLRFGTIQRDRERILYPRHTLKCLILKFKFFISIPLLIIWKETHLLVNYCKTSVFLMQHIPNRHNICIHRWNKRCSKRSLQMINVNS